MMGKTLTMLNRANREDEQKMGPRRETVNSSY